MPVHNPVIVVERSHNHICPWRGCRMRFGCAKSGCAGWESKCCEVCWKAHHLKQDGKTQDPAPTPAEE